MKLPILLWMIATLLSAPPLASTARILGVFPHIGKSHFFVFEPYLQALASRGHDVHVISHFPQDTPIPHYTDISVRGSIPEDIATGGIHFDRFTIKPSLFTTLATVYILGSAGSEACEAVYSFPSVTKLLNSNEKFDLVITELFNTDCFLGFVHKFQAPHVALSSCVLMPWASDRFGNPDHPGFIPNNLARFGERMTFIERLENSLTTVLVNMMYYAMFSRSSQAIASKYLGEAIPNIEDIARNTSLILVNSHPTLNRARPLSPLVIDVGGIHVKPPKKLPQELDQWLNEAPEGVIFFSMGSMLRAESLPQDKLSALVRAFTQLPQRVLWKWEGDSLPGQPSNVRIHKWLSQRDILNHPKVRVFVTHCGLLGVTEAVQSGVPMVGMPMFGDQNTNCQAIKSAGVAVLVDYHELTEQSLLTALRAVLDNSTYRENAKRLSHQYQDRISPPMDTAIFWTEYVIRHRGTPNLRPASVDLAWYQYLLLDVAVVLVGPALLLIYVAVVIARRLGRKMWQRCCMKKDEKQKQN